MCTTCLGEQSDKLWVAGLAKDSLEDNDQFDAQRPRRRLKGEFDILANGRQLNE